MKSNATLFQKVREELDRTGFSYSVETIDGIPPVLSLEYSGSYLAWKSVIVAADDPERIVLMASVSLVIEPQAWAQCEAFVHQINKRHMLGCFNYDTAGSMFHFYLSYPLEDDNYCKGLVTLLCAVVCDAMDGDGHRFLQFALGAASREAARSGPDGDDLEAVSSDLPASVPVRRLSGPGGHSPD